MTKWFVVVGIILMLCIAEWIRELYTFKITHYYITSDKLQGLHRSRTIAFLSDLHNNCYGKDNIQLLQALRQQKPDLILVGGDMLVGKRKASPQVARTFLEEVTEISPVYYANGNHEQRMKLNPHKYGEKYQQYHSALQQKGVEFLENTSIEFVLDDTPIRISGLEIPMKAYKRKRKELVSPKEIEHSLGCADPSFYQILLAHNPLYTDSYIDWGADLILSGHLHGGVVRIPGIGGLITPKMRLFPKYSGELTLHGKSSIVVSKGLGTHTIKLRFLNPAEVVILHLCNGEDNGGKYGNSGKIRSV